MHLFGQSSQGLRFFILLSFICFFISCGEGSSLDSNKTEVSKIQESAQGFVSKFDHLPRMPEGKRREITGKVDEVDYIFHELDMSLAIGDDYAKNSMFLLLDTKPIFSEACEKKGPTGRVTILGKGELLMEGDFYFSEQCQYFVFFEGEQAVYADAMSELALNFMNSVYEEINTNGQ